MSQLVYKTRQKRGYLYRNIAITDTSNTSPLYFNIAEVPTTFTAGKNIIKCGLNGPFLQQGSEFDLEVLDFEGNPVYVEYTGFVDRLKFHYFSVYVYDTTKQGSGILTLVGAARIDPNGQPITNPASQHSTEYNVRWSTTVAIKPLERNTTDIYFADGPTVTVAQVLTPYKFNLGTYSINKTLYTQTLSGLQIITTPNKGVDFSINSSNNVLDIESVNNTYNYFQKSSTANTVKTNIRKNDGEIINGYMYSEYSRYSTVLYDSQSRLSKDMEGSTFSFSNQDAGVSILNNLTYYPFTGSSTIEISGGSGSLPNQLNNYTPKIVTVLNNKYALLDSPPTVKVLDKSGKSQPVIRDFQFTKIENVTGSFAYPTSSTNEIQSINLSSSYLQFTVLDLKPLSGDVYRIKTYVKEAGQNTEYYQLNDHTVTPPEYLIDSDKPNQAVYAKNKSDFFTYGEFTNPAIPADYWRGFITDQLGEVQQYSFNNTASISNYPLANALRVYSSGSIRRGLTSRYYQTYVEGEPYSISFYCVLDPDLELEVYMSSTPLKENLLGFQAPRAFASTANYYPEISSSLSKFGKYIGKITNASGSGTRRYENVVFDFFPDAEGFGRPLFYLRNAREDVSGSAYISSVSITPLDLVGYTPSILQFSAAPPDSLWILYDDDARLSQSIDVKMEYYSADGKQSEYVTYIPNVLLNMINEVPGFCAGGTSKFNDQCPFYYEIGTSSLNNLARPSSATASLDPTQYSPVTYFWPTFSVNSYAGYSWNLRSFSIPVGAYDQVNYNGANSLITSSWLRYDPILPLYGQPIPGNTPFDVMYYVTASGPNTPVTYSSTWLDERSTVATPGTRPFYKANGAVVSKYDIAYSQSVLLFESNSRLIQQDPTKLRNFEKYLRTTRLYFPATQGSYPYDFYENGAIYNVRFNLSRVGIMAGTYANYPDNNTVITNAVNSKVSTWTSLTVKNDKFQPDKTGAKLMVYIADVASTIPSNRLLIPGIEGFIPPKNNIATILDGGSGGVTPAIRYYDSGSGYFVDTYDLMLVQYGEKAQLVFDACGLEFEIDDNETTLSSSYSGSYKIFMTSSRGFWGGVISDIEWCKVGITTDPKYIKPTNFNDAFNTYIPYNLPPPIPPRNPFLTSSLEYNPSWPGNNSA